MEKAFYGVLTDVPAGHSQNVFMLHVPPPNFVEKTFAKSPKTNISENFPSRKFPTIIIIHTVPLGCSTPFPSTSITYEINYYKSIKYSCHCNATCGTRCGWLALTASNLSSRKLTSRKARNPGMYGSVMVTSMELM